MDVEQIEQPYYPPTHLRTHQSFGGLPIRTFFGLLYPAVAGVPLAWTTWNATGGLVLPTIGAEAVPILVCSPMAAWWLHPPAEQGLFKALAFAKRAYLPAIPDPQARVAVYRMPAYNLETAPQAVRDRARASWARVLNGLSHPVKIVIRSRTVQTVPMVQDLATSHHPRAPRLAAWLEQHLVEQTLIDRDRFLVVPAGNDSELRFRCKALEKLLRRNHLSGERVDPADLPLLRTFGWNPHAPTAEVGPEIHEGWTEALLNGWWVRTYAVSELPSSILTDWASPLLADDDPLDVAIDVYPQSMTYIKLLVAGRIAALESSRHSEARVVALEQLRLLQRALERRLVKPFDMSITIMVRDNSQRAVREHGRLVERRVEELGGKLALLRWEQAAGAQTVADITRTRSLGRAHLVETGTVARTYPWADGSLQVEGGVVWGVAGDRVCIFTPFVRTSRGSHMAWYGMTNSGKSTGAHMLWSRLHLVKGIRIFGIDQDEQHEHCGRFLQYLGGYKLEPRDAKDVMDIRLHRDDGVVVLDLSARTEQEVGPIFAAWGEVVKQHMLAWPGPSIFFVDEATRVAETEIGGLALRQAFNRARHWGQSSHALTQRPTDWFRTKVGRAVRGNCDAWWCGGQQPGEVDDVARGLRLSAEEAELIRNAPIGEGLLVQGQRRVWLDLYDKLSAEEYEAFNTDPILVPQLELVLEEQVA